MKKLNLRSSKGVTLISLSITIILILILSAMIIYNVPDYIQTKRLKDLQNDIQVIEERVKSYYAKNEKIPGKLEYKWSINPSKTYYIVDLQALDGLTLNYGKEGYNAYNDVRNAVLNGTITTAQQTALNNITDIFIMDGETLDVYYVKGLTLDGFTYYSYD